ncbi:unnamed protein product [Caenorhabditis angaria]|uniref:Spindle assembly abnormal protein 5 implico domain-containing protein n=1 Tax=Caenorhabditis angaria TaxID=860376 RepID=A0A9P1MTG9_9PELO|nr:unnamed protein product [Caenorhabditis angaria]
MNYEELPCSVYLPNLKKPEEERNNQIVKKVSIASQPKETVQGKKSCLSTNTSTNKDPPPNHPALKKKTVAFGKTVNVSQTIEGTSRAARKSSENTKKMSNTANPETDWKSEMQKEIEEMKKELLEITEKKQEANISEIKNMMVNLFQEYSAKPKSIEAEPKKTTKMTSARYVFKKDGVLNSEAIEILEKRTRNDPIFRQQIDDVLADAEYETKKYEEDFRSRSPYQAKPIDSAALMRETYTVERSIRFDGNSIDSRNWQTSNPRNCGNNSDRWYEPEVLHSTYQPGNSISYYPSENHPALKNPNNDYFIEHAESSENDENSKFNETRAEKERRIREKYSRRK